MTVKGIEDIKYAEKIKEATNGAYLMKGLREDMIAVSKPNQEEIFYSAGKKKGYKADREVVAFLLDHSALEGEKDLDMYHLHHCACSVFS